MNLGLLMHTEFKIIFELLVKLVDFGGLGVTCSPRDPRFAGSNPTEVNGFFQHVKILRTTPPGRTFS